MTYADIPIASPIVTNTDIGKAATGNHGRYDVPRSACNPARPKLTDHIFGEYETVEFRYVLKEVLGDGKLGVVRRCVEKDSGTEWACKTIKKSQLIYRDDIEAVRNEVAAMMELSEHFVIANLHDVIEDDSVSSPYWLWTPRWLQTDLILLTMPTLTLSLFLLLTTFPLASSAPFRPEFTFDNRAVQGWGAV